MDFEAAEKHCLMHYDVNDPVNSKVVLFVFFIFYSIIF